MSGKTFYIETFGCQMNVHDSEKVIGTLMAQGYSKVETPEDAGKTGPQQVEVTVEQDGKSLGTLRVVAQLKASGLPQ